MDLPRLAAAIDAAAPSCRRRSGRPGSFQSHILRRVLIDIAKKHFDLAKKHFITDEYGWWHIEKRSAECKTKYSQTPSEVDAFLAKMKGLQPRPDHVAA